MKPKVRDAADKHTLTKKESGRAPGAEGTWTESRAFATVLVGVVYSIFALATVGVTWHLRSAIRQQIISRDAEVLQAVLWMQLGATDSAENPENQPLLPLSEPAEQANMVLRAARLKGILAACLHDTNGGFVVAFPPTVRPARLLEEDLVILRRLEYLSRYYAEARLTALFEPMANPRLPGQPVPLLEILLPIYEPDSPRLLGVVRFYVDAKGLREKFSVLDRDLLGQTLVVLLVGGAIIIAGLGGALHRLQRQHAVLRELTVQLARANQELTLAAKSSAVGAVAAHLIHGLKSPLYGLHSLLLSRAMDQQPASEPAWQAALKTTRELQQMINETARLLKDEGAPAADETTLSELVGLVANRLGPLFQQARVTLAVDLQADARLPGREAALVALVLENLLRNAAQATPSDKAVRLQVRPAEGGVACAVHDQGGGFPEALRPNLFLPCASSKPGGLGIGLAISKQLANHLGARLELTSSTPQGCVFTLTLPRPAEPKPPPPAQTRLASLAIIH